MRRDSAQSARRRPVDPEDDVASDDAGPRGGASFGDRHDHEPARLARLALELLGHRDGLQSHPEPPSRDAAVPEQSRDDPVDGRSGDDEHFSTWREGRYAEARAGEIINRAALLGAPE